MQDIISQDLQVNWHPCMQMKDFATWPPLAIKFAKAEFLIDYDGNSYLDATSSWWCKSLGHSHPKLQQALVDQLYQLEHVIYANTTYSKIVELSNKLTNLVEHGDRVLYASDGSCAVEIAVKMSLQANQIAGNNKDQLAALAGGYHGETILTLGLSDCELYAKPFKKLLPKVNLITAIPVVTSSADPLWHNAKLAWQEAEQQLADVADKLSCIVLEPIIQGAGGMRIYSPDFLARLAVWAKQHQIHLIVDEIMTGFARSGKMFAYQHANIQPDFICLGKALTAGMLPMSAVVTTASIYDLFYDDYSSGKAFLHSHTHSGNALAAAVACAAIDLYLAMDIEKLVAELESKLLQAMQLVVAEVGCVDNLRGLGGMVAVDLQDVPQGVRLAQNICYAARGHGVLMRPLGNTLYWLPPLITSETSVDLLAKATISAIKSQRRGCGLD